MGIFLRHSWNVKPLRWGSFADVQYAIKVNSEKIYGIDSDNDVLVMPGFWGLPPLDYSGYNNHGTNYGATYKDGSLDFDGNDYVDIGNILTEPFTFSVCVKDAISNSISSPVWGGEAVKVYPSLNLNYVTQAKVLIYMGQHFYQYYTVNNLYDGNSHHIVFVVPGTTLSAWKVYEDGISLAVSTNKEDTGSETKDVGYIGRAGTNYINNILDEVRISNVARTADQIALFHDLPWDLYRPVSRPVWSIPAVGGVAPTANLYGSFYGPLAGVI